LPLPGPEWWQISLEAQVLKPSFLWRIFGTTQSFPDTKAFQSDFFRRILIELAQHKRWGRG
jgi:hypothetical protein